MRSSIGGARMGLGFVIQRQQVLASLTPMAGPVVRGDSATHQDRLLLSDTVVLGQRKVMVEMRIAQTHDREHIDLHVSLVSSTPLTDPVYAMLKRDQETRSAAVRDGKCSFGGIPSPPSRKVAISTSNSPPAKRWIKQND